MAGVLDRNTRKAQVAALIAFLGPIATFVALEGGWDWRAFIGSVITGIIAGLTVYNTSNETAAARRARRGTGGHL